MRLVVVMFLILWQLGGEHHWRIRSFESDLLCSHSSWAPAMHSIAANVGIAND